MTVNTDIKLKQTKENLLEIRLTREHVATYFTRSLRVICMFDM